MWSGEGMICDCRMALTNGRSRKIKGLITDYFIDGSMIRVTVSYQTIEVQILNSLFFNYVISSVKRRLLWHLPHRVIWWVSNMYKEKIIDIEKIINIPTKFKLLFTNWHLEGHSLGYLWSMSCVLGIASLRRKKQRMVFAL